MLISVLFSNSDTVWQLSAWSVL